VVIDELTKDFLFFAEVSERLAWINSVDEAAKLARFEAHWWWSIHLTLLKGRMEECFKLTTGVGGG